ncbi:ion transporter [Pontivivens ytuae]|uniref:Ion transporter n=2 Tax=Pontivivens ytuae TaxID=2789856 RepID=A0A7S9LS23_9RHOB|nr:ion transporter [Pontivivens ytuae]
MSMSMQIMPSWPISRRLREILERDLVKNTILGIIVLNAIVLGLGTSSIVSERVGPLLDIIDWIVVVAFTVEIVAKLIAYGPSFFRSPWNIFDLVIVIASHFPQSDGVKALRGLRVIRALRLLSIVPQMQSVVRALLDALPGMAAVMVLLSIVYYVFAVITTVLYGDTFPQWFGSLGASLYTLFQIMTLESWSMGIVRPVMEEHPRAWIVFVPFIVMTAFAVLNLFIGLLVNTMQAAVEAEAEREADALRETLDAQTAQITALTEEVRRLAERGGRHG